MSKNKIIKNTYSYPLKIRNSQIKETNSQKCLISLEMVIDCPSYGLCLNSNHSQFKNQNSKEYNTKLIKLFHFLCQKTWDEIYQTQKQHGNGYEHTPKISYFYQKKKTLRIGISSLLVHLIYLSFINFIKLSIWSLTISFLNINFFLFFC